MFIKLETNPLWFIHLLSQISDFFYSCSDFYTIFIFWEDIYCQSFSEFNPVLFLFFLFFSFSCFWTCLSLTTWKMSSTSLLDQDWTVVEKICFVPPIWTFRFHFHTEKPLTCDCRPRWRWSKYWYFCLPQKWKDFNFDCGILLPCSWSSSHYLHLCETSNCHSLRLFVSICWHKFKIDFNFLVRLKHKDDPIMSVHGPPTDLHLTIPPKHARYL